MSARRSRAVWLPAIVIALVAAVLIAGLLRGGQDPLVRSALVGKPLPVFVLAPARVGLPGVASRSFADGRPRLVNIFASWCAPCRDEAPQLAALAARGVRIEGIAIRDRPADLARFLEDHGNPYAAIGDDRDSRVQILLGSAGVPETFVIDGGGIIRGQLQGPVTADMVAPLAALLAARK